MINYDIVFTKYVFYLCQNDRHGDMGLIINKPLADTLNDVFEELHISHTKTFKDILEYPLYMGGP
ncbi:YqgE/AlgH family protein, partial [Francisella tularensis]|uniref:YqgE/AlgH family protein n=1 Tax=Francisella tularensis TaxID=263 RepID=UPI002381ACD9